MGFRIIFTDMDDTFLTSSKAIPEPNERLLCALDELACGDDVPVRVVPCTGRMPRGIPAGLTRHRCVTHAVCSMGANVVAYEHLDAAPSAEATWHSLNQRGIEKCVVLDLWHAVQPLDIQFDVFVNGTSYSEAARLARVEEFPMPAGMLAFVKEQRTPVTDLDELIRDLPVVERLNVYFKTRDDMDRVNAAAEAVGLHHTFHDECGLEITLPDVDKGTGIRWLCNELGISREETLAFGDAENDLPMLRAVGTSVAMANATQEAKATATRVCPWDNNAGGVGRLAMELLGI